MMEGRPLPLPTGIRPRRRAGGADSQGQPDPVQEDVIKRGAGEAGRGGVRVLTAADTGTDARIGRESSPSAPRTRTSTVSPGRRASWYTSGRINPRARMP